MSTAEWGVLLGAIGTVTGTFGLLWRVFEWWDARRPSIQVTASAGRLITGGGRPFVASGERFGDPDLVTVTAICKGRTATVTKCGFYDRKTKVQYGIPLPIFGELPAKLERGEAVTIAARAEALTEEVDSFEHIVPFCEDAEGRTYSGKTDDHFRRLVH